MCGGNGVDRPPRVRTVQCREAGVLVNLPAVSVETVLGYDNVGVCLSVCPLSVVSVCLFFLYPSICLFFLYPSICPLIRLSLYLSVWYGLQDR